MRISVERLRIGLLVGAGLLVLIVAGFLGYARYRVHRAIAALPGRLGATITKEFDGYTYSQSDGKRTIFTIHAAKAIQHKDGTYTLHDVNMMLYGKKGDRADHISGDEFEYDTKAEVIRAEGVVHLDLQAPVPQGAAESGARKHLGASSASATAQGGGATGRVIHVTTSGLVYLKKLGVAATDAGVDFQFGGFSGHAVGAEYSSDAGHVVLQSAITVSGVDKGRPVALTSTHGELDRTANLAVFRDAHYRSAGETAQAEVAQLHLRTDGSVERVEAERQVTLENAAQGTVTADRADVALDPASRPKTAVLNGRVRFIDDQALKQARGESDQANLHFDDQGHVDHAVLHGNVHNAERLRVKGDEQVPWSERDLFSDDLEVLLTAAEGAGERPQIHDVKATGSVHLTTASTVTKMATGTVCGNQPVQGGRCSISTTTKLSGDTVQAHLIPLRGRAELSTVHGTGHTVVEQKSSTGLEQRSSGETLDAVFKETSSGKGAVELATAVQAGNVSMERRMPVPKGPDANAAVDPLLNVQHATAGRAGFDMDTGRFTLFGNVQMSDAGRDLSAVQVVMERDSGDATAEGAVKVTYLQPGSAEPIHVLASHAELEHDAERATFYGAAASAGSKDHDLARMWQAGSGGQGGSQIEAPILIFEQEQKRLTARGLTTRAMGQVHAVLANATPVPSATGNAPVASVTKAAAARPKPQDVTRILSSEMIYSDVQRQAQFTGGVLVASGTGQMRAREATVFLEPAMVGKVQPPEVKASGPAAGKAGTAASGLNGLFGGSVQRIVATRDVEITEPGRRATGERLVYTANDQLFVLTGTAAVPPKVVDALQGMATGAALRFHSGDDSVVISGRDGDLSAQKVHTETRLKQ